MATEITESWLACQIVKRLRDQLARNEANCYEVETIGADDPVTAAGQFILQVAIGETTYDQADGEQDLEVCIATTEIEVGIITTIFLDQRGKVHNMLDEKDRGLRCLAKQVRQALVGFDPDGKLASLMSCRRMSQAHYDPRKQAAWRTLTFAATYDDDLVD